MRLALFLCALLLMAGTAHGAKGDGANAATWYRRASERFSAVALTDAERLLTPEFQHDPSRGPSDSVRELVSRYQSAIVYSLRGGKQHRCDYRLNFAATGPFTRQNHLQQLRDLSRLLQTDSMIRLCDDDVDGAIERLSAMYHIAIHAAQDRTVVSSLAAGSLFSNAEAQMQDALEHGAVGPLEAGSLLRAIGLADMDDPVNYAKSIAHEREICTQWMIDRYSGQGGAERLAEDRSQFELPEQLSRLAGCAQSDLDAALKGVDKAVQRLMDAVAHPDADRVRTEFAALNDQAQHGDFGPLARDTVARMTSAFAACQASKMQLRSRRTQLTEIAEGRLDPKNFANAAVWYIRAAVALEKLPTDHLELIRQYANEHDKAPSPGTAEILVSPEAAIIIQTLRDASSMTVCDFRFARPAWPQALRHYQGGMLQCGRLLTADAVRLIHAGDVDSAIDRLAIGYRLSVNLSLDNSIPGSLVAQAVFNSSEKIVTAAIEGNMFTDQQAAVLSRVVRGFSLTEPFHYQTAIGVLKSDLQPWLVEAFEGDRNQDNVSNVRAFLGRCDADALLFLSVVRDYTRDDSATALRQYSRQVGAMDEVISPDAFQQALNQTPILKRHVERGELEQIDPTTFPSMGHVVQHMADARAEVRQCQSRLKTVEAGGAKSNTARRAERRP